MTVDVMIVAGDAARRGWKVIMMVITISVGAAGVEGGKSCDNGRYDRCWRRC